MSKKILALYLLLSLILLSSCKSLDENEVAYGSDERQVMDIHLPENLKEDETRPVVLYIHGGGWVGGDKSSFSTQLEPTLELGYIYASMNYHYAVNGDNYLTMINDVKLAIDYLYEHHEQYQIDTTGIALVGNSAGAHLAMLFAYKLNDGNIPVSLVVSEVGPTDFTDPSYDDDFIVSDIEALIPSLIGKTYDASMDLSKDPDLIDASPLYHVDQNTVPTIMVYGKLDRLIPYSNPVILDDKLTKFNIDHVFFTYEHSDHGLRNNLDSETKLSYRQALIEYLEKYLPID